MEDRGFNYEELQFIKGVFEQTTEDYIFIYDLIRDHYMISECASKIFQLSSYDFGNATDKLKEVIHPDDYEMVAEDLAQIREMKKTKHSLEYRWKIRNGRYVWISCRGEAVINSHGEYLVGIVKEIGKHNRLDNITGLYCENVLEAEFNKDGHEKGDSGCLMLIGIDNFKEINEKHGPEIGNKVLENVAEILLERMGDSKQVYRMRGDEFAIIVPGIFDNEEGYMKKLYKDIRSDVDSYIEYSGYKLFFTISAGCVLFDTCRDRYEDVLKNLRFALHSAKLSGKNKFCMFSNEEYQTYIRKIDIQENLRVCINNEFDGFELYYQPIYDTDKKRIHGAEALIRWNSKKYGFMSPISFIPLLEDSALIIPLGRWIIEEAAVQCNEWCKLIPDFVMHINLSFIQVIKSDIVKDILAGIRNCNIDHSHFVFEVTESGKIESSEVVHHVLTEIHNNDFKLAIDDFGTGYSNMRYIKDMMFGIIKIDRAFITDINKNFKNYMLVKSMIEMVHGLNLSVCVEGVETQEELETVLSLKPDKIQGYYYGTPVPSEEFEKMHFVQLG